MIKLRPYQSDAIKAVMDYWAAGGKNPLVEMATGTGKSVLIAALLKALTDAYPGMRFLMLTHVKELVSQNFAVLLRLWPDAPVGIYSAGLNRRNSHQRIIFASVQSVYKRAQILGPRDLICIDEAHLIPKAGAGMYRHLLDRLTSLQPDLRLIGFTATPYRLDSGRLDQGDDRLFDATVYDYDIGKGIADGFLSPLISKATAAQIDVSGVAKKGGEYVGSALEKASDRITGAAVEEIISLGAARKSWLVFCSGIQHALNVRDALRARGITAETVSGKTPHGERDSIIRRFKAGEIRALTNANVLTTGFDAPQIDLITMLRPTLSTALYVQIVGRGTRLAPGKENCLVLDFAGNVARHGPVDAVVPSGSGGGKGKGDAPAEAPAKECPECHSLIVINIRICPDCGYEFPFLAKPKHEAQADGDSGILTTEKLPPKMLPVVDWQLRKHDKLHALPTLQVSYFAGLGTYPEWVAFEHGGFAGQKAQQWWVAHGGRLPTPKTVPEALQRRDELKMPATISVRAHGKYWDIVGRNFEKREIPA